MNNQTCTNDMIFTKDGKKTTSETDLGGHVRARSDTSGGWGPHGSGRGEGQGRGEAEAMVTGRSTAWRSLAMGRLGDAGRPGPTGSGEEEAGAAGS